MKFLQLITFCMLWTLSVACSNNDTVEGNLPLVESEVNGTAIDESTTLYGLITDQDNNPIADVVVSDGYNCVVTDRNGVYQMDRYKKARYVYYSTPSGYQVNTGDDNLPIFYSKIVHKNMTDRHDFKLTKLTKAEDNFTLLCIADPQCGSTSNITRFVNETVPDMERTVDSYKNNGTPVYGMTLGDIVFDTPDLWSNMKEAMSNRNFTFFQTIGNHDHLKSETSDDNAAENFELQFGPRNYSFNRGGVHIVSVDNVFYVGGSTASTNYKGGITDKQMEWLRQDLQNVPRSQTVILCAHIPFRTGSSTTDESNMNYDNVLNLLAEFDQAHIMIGHTHYHQKYVHNRGDKKIMEHIHGAASGAWWTSNMCVDGTPNGYGVFEITNGSVSNHYYKSTHKDASYQIRAYSAKQIYGTSGSTTFSWASNLSATNDARCIVANIWNSDNANWTVALYQDGQKVSDMTRFSSADYWTYAFHVMYCSKSVGSTWGKTLDHFYYGKLNSGTPETATFEIVAEDGMGNTYRTSTIQSDFMGF